MRLLLPIFVIGSVVLPLISATPVALGDGFYLPRVDNVESHIDNLWTNFKKGYGIVYNTTMEELHRFKIFANHVKMIVKHNLEHDLGLHTYRLGVNKYATLVSRTWRTSMVFHCSRFRPIKSSVRSSTAIVARRTLSCKHRMFVAYMSLLRLTLPFRRRSIGAIKVWLHP
jgi:hypothetical protein